VGYLDTETKEKLFSLFIGIIKGNLIAVTDSLIDLNVGYKDIDREALKAGLHSTLSDYYDRPLDHLPIGEVFQNAIDTARKSQIKLPGNLVLLGKSLFTVDGFGRELCPGFNIVQYARPFLKDLTKKRLKPKDLAEETLTAALGFKKMLLNAPRYVDNLNRQVTLIEDRITRYEDIVEKYHDWMTRITRAVIYAVLLTPIMITSALMIGKGPIIAGIPIISVLGFASCILLLISMLYTLNRKNGGKNGT
jgi:ubiquinone biosynthesis protein